MNKQVIAVVLAVVVVGGAFFAYTKMNNKSGAVAEQNPYMQNGNSSGVESTNPNANSTSTTQKKLPFIDFIKQGGSYVCTVGQTVDSIKSSGTFYINGAMSRGEFATEVKGMKIDSTFVVKDGYSYSWSSIVPGMGYKVAIDQNASSGTSGNSSGSYAFNSEKIGDYDCKPWTPDNSKFNLPSTIKFTEVKK